MALSSRRIFSSLKSFAPVYLRPPTITCKSLFRLVVIKVSVLIMIPGLNNREGSNTILTLRPPPFIFKVIFITSKSLFRDFRELKVVFRCIKEGGDGEDA